MRVQVSDLPKAVYHIAFDMYYFLAYWKLLKQPKGYMTHVRDPKPGDGVPQAVHQAVIYSLLLHFRVLLYFFFYTPKGDDCGVDDFRQLPEFDRDFPHDIHDPLVDHQIVRANLNKRLAHFTATRWREKQPGMDHYDRFFPQIETLIARFEAALPVEYQQIFRERMNHWARGDQPSAR